MFRADVLGAKTDFVDLNIHIWQWLGLLGIIVVLLAIDLVRHRDAHEPTIKSAAYESLFWVFCGLSFGVAVLVGFGRQAGQEYFGGYVLEKSLSVDNVFVWALLFSAFKTPLKYQHRVLFWGIFGALALRAIFIGLGAAIVSRFAWVLVLFGLFLVYTGYKLLRPGDSHEEAKTPGLGLLRKFMPVSDELDGQKFFTRINGVRMATPLFATLVVVEATDVLFAVDSVPAILAISHDPFLVFSSNAFAILGLRAMYFLLADARQRFRYLATALGAVLVFVGAKMILSPWYHVPITISLGVIVIFITAGVVVSLLRTRPVTSPA